MKKLLIIESCEGCPHLDIDPQLDPNKWGTSWCNKADKEITNKNAKIDEETLEIKGFPNFCPLKTVK